MPYFGKVIYNSIFGNPNHEYFLPDIRLKFVTLLMLIVSCLSLTVTVLKFGIGALEDNFVAQLNTNYSSSAEFMAFYGILNFYLFTSAYVYSPCDKSIVGKFIVRWENDFVYYSVSLTLADSELYKDNPTLSMITDSDEDVIYGSDDETRRPLNRGGNDNEESDWTKEKNLSHNVISDKSLKNSVSLGL